MAVPARPVGGASIDAAWGGVVHDTAVAMDIQMGTGSITMNGTAQTQSTVTFPRPFASAPVVMVGYTNGNRALIAYATPNANGQTFALTMGTTDAGNNSSVCNYAWLAYGPRA